MMATRTPVTSEASAKLSRCHELPLRRVSPLPRKITSDWVKDEPENPWARYWYDFIRAHQYFFLFFFSHRELYGIKLCILANLLGYVQIRANPVQIQAN